MVTPYGAAGLFYLEQRMLSPLVPAIGVINNLRHFGPRNSRRIPRPHPAPDPRGDEGVGAASGDSDRLALAFCEQIQREFEYTTKPRPPSRCEPYSAFRKRGLLSFR